MQVPHDHYLDDFILIESYASWLMAGVHWVMAMLMVAGYVISKKSVPEQTARAKWLGKAPKRGKQTQNRSRIHSSSHLDISNPPKPFYSPELWSYFQLRPPAEPPPCS